MRTTFLAMTAATAATVLLIALPAGAIASTSPTSVAPGTHTAKLIKLPNGDYTVPMNELIDPAWTGKVVLHPQGLQTLVTVIVRGQHFRRHALELHPGGDCSAFGAADGIALNPANTGVPSQTLVSLPITDLTSKDYVIAARDATRTAQNRESCAHL